MKPRTTLYLALALALAAGCFSERVATTEPPKGDCALTLEPGDLGTAQVVVAVRGFAFEPAEVRVRPGTRVTWVNCEEAVAHTSTAQDGAWASPLLQPGERYSFTFEEAGRFPYHCVPHPGMVGEVVVEE